MSLERKRKSLWVACVLNWSSYDTIE